MAAEQNHASSLKRLSALHSDLPQVFVEREDDPGISFADLDDRRIRHAAKIRQRPNNIVAIGSQHVNEFSGEVLVGQQPHYQAGAG